MTKVATLPAVPRGRTPTRTVTAHLATPILDAALDYAAEGLYVLPVMRATKQPYLAHGLTDASTDPTVIKGWWKRWPDANVAVRIPSNRVVIDVDGPAGIAASKAAGMNDTGPILQTGRPDGLHFWFATDEPVGPGRAILGEGSHVDRRSGDRGYTVMPPSIHANGTTYRWLRTPSEAQPPPAEPWMLETRRKTPSAPSVPEPGNWSRDDLVSLAGAMRRRGATEEAILAALQATGARHSDGTPYETADLRRIAASIALYPPHEALDGPTDGRELTIGSMTAWDLPYGPPPDQLADPFLTPEGVTILYGKGGTGKGVTASYLIQRLVKTGLRVMILDFENHQREWGSRLRGLGVTEDQLRTQIFWRSPSSDDWTAQRGTIGVVAGLIREQCDALNVDILVTDSYSVASNSGDEMGGQKGAQEFFDGIRLIGRPALVIAHVSSAATRFPDKPFGSVFVHNLARETWAVEARDTPDIEYDPDTEPYQPHVVALELRNMKANGRGKGRPEFLTFSFNLDGTIDTANTRPEGSSIAAHIWSVLADGLMTTKAIRAAILEDYGETHDDTDINRTIARKPDRFATDKSERPYRHGRRG